MNSSLAEKLRANSFFKHFVRPVTAVLLLGVALLTACDNTLEPLNTEKGTYSIYGYLDVRDAVNYIRVKNLNIPLQSDTFSVLDADVTLTDVDRGSSAMLTDTVVVFDGVQTHNFMTRMDIRPETTYRLTVDDRKGTTVSATTTTPGIAETHVQPVGGDCITPITYTFSNVGEETILSAQVRFEMSNTDYFINRLFIPERIVGFDGTVSFTVSPAAMIYDAICGQSPECDLPPVPPAPCYLLSSDELTLQYIHYGPDYELRSGNVSDSLGIPGGAGSLVGLLQDSYTFRIDTSKIPE